MKRLAVFFTRGVSLRQWLETGLLHREQLVYINHLNQGFFDTIFWLTYGRDDSSLAELLHREGKLDPRIKVLGMPKAFPYLGKVDSLFYSLMMPLCHSKQLSECGVLKTNQMDGSIAGLISSKLFNVPLYLRTGYTLSLFTKRIHKNNVPRDLYAWIVERFAYHNCAASSVSSNYDRKYISKRFKELLVKPIVVGNYVDVDSFAPRAGRERLDRVLFVGRISRQKNVHAAIEACAEVGIGLDLVGTGPDINAMKSLAAKVGADLRWLGVISNSDLPDILASYRYFLLPSLWEGLPKALLEAMAMGMVCIGTNVTGVNELLVDGVTGFVSETSDASDIAKTITKALKGDHLTIGNSARNLISQEYSLDIIASREREIYFKMELVGEKRFWHD